MIESNGSIYSVGSNLRKMSTNTFDNYKLQVDPNPTVIKKKLQERVTIVQNVSLKFLKPIQSEQPGDITIIQESDVQTKAAPPVILRITPNKAFKQEPIVFRERPPVSPKLIAPKNIIIPGRVLPPPPRQVIIEKLAPQPQKSQDIIIERWLGYPKRIRNVTFQAPVPLKPIKVEKNVRIEWEAPDFQIKQEFKFLGVHETDPQSYNTQFGNTLVEAVRLPKEAAQFTTPVGETLACESNSNEVPFLRGAVQALRNLNLHCHGLSEYKSQI